MGNGGKWEILVLNMKKIQKMSVTKAVTQLENIEIVLNYKTRVKHLAKLFIPTPSHRTYCHLIIIITYYQ